MMSSRFFRACLTIALLSPTVAAAKAPRTWQWEEGGIFGRAEEIGVPQGRTFDGMVSDYLSRMAGLCPDGFAEQTDPPRVLGARILQTGEVACASAPGEPVAALLFVQAGRTFTVIAHEGSATQIDAILDRRDASARDFGP